MTEASVVDLEDHLHPAEPDDLCAFSSDAGKSDEYPDEFQFFDELSSGQSSDDSEIDLTEPEALKSDGVNDLAPSFNGPVSAENTTSDLSFVLNPNVKEHRNNNNNNNNILLSDSCNGSQKNWFEMAEDKADPLAETDRVQLTEDSVPSSPQKRPNQLLEFYQSEENEVDEDGSSAFWFQNTKSARTSGSSSEGMQTQPCAIIREVYCLLLPVLCSSWNEIVKSNLRLKEKVFVLFLVLFDTSML